ncbi:MAG: hypothetical protein ACLQGU_00005, partial [bacterium]
VAFHKNPVMGCVLLSIGIAFAKNLSQEDNTPLSFYTEDLTSASSPETREITKALIQTPSAK